MKLLVRTLSLLALVPLASTTTACGDDDGGGGTPAAPFESTTQTDDTKVATAMTPAEQTAFCQELQAYFEREVPEATLTRFSCYFLALTFTGGDASACQEAAQRCIEDGGSDFSTDSASCDEARLTDCTASVDELEACYTATVTAFKSIAARVSCSTSAADLQGLDEPPAACQTVKTKCPKLFEENDEPAAGDGS